MPTLDSRLRKLETTQFAHHHHACLVLHGEPDCDMAREKAIAAYIVEHGRKPENFVNLWWSSKFGHSDRFFCCHVMFKDGGRQIAQY